MNPARTGLFWLALICAVFGLAVVTMLLFVGPARSHNWYSPYCCSDKDCAPVPDGTVAEKPDGFHVSGFGILSRTDPRIHRSHDDADHLCVRGGKIQCVYVRPSST